MHADSASAKSRKPLWLRIFHLCLGVAYGGYFAFAFLVVFDSLEQLTDLNAHLILGASVLVLVVSQFALVAVHESGHAVAAIVAGWRVSMVTVGRIAIRLFPLNVRVGHRITKLNGATFTVPAETHDLKRKWILVMAGGALANLAFGFVVIVCVRLFGDNSPIDLILLSLAGLSMVMGIANLVPFKAREGWSDGKLIHDAIVGRDLGPFIRNAQVVDAILRGQRPRDWPHELMERVETDSALPDASGHESVLLHAYYFDKWDFDKARSALVRAQERLGRLDELRVTEAFFRAYAESDFAAARSILDGVSSRLRRRPNYLRTEALLLLGEGKASAARQAISQARRAFARWPLSTPDDEELLDELDRRTDALEVSNALASPV